MGPVELQSYYQPLVGSEIRLLKILGGEWDEMVECELEVAPLDDAPSYQALTYAWGDPDDTVNMSLDGRPWKVSRNLFTFLRQIRARHRMRDNILNTKEEKAAMPRDKSPSSPPFAGKLVDLRIWVDALCIDQTSTTEKEAQIPRMGSIYRTAYRVYVWLGENPNGPQDNDVFEEGIDVTRSEGNGSIVQKLDGPKEETDRFLAVFLGLFQRPWFERIWVVQEVTLATLEPLVLLGNAFYELRILCWAYHRISLAAVSIGLASPYIRQSVTSEIDPRSVAYLRMGAGRDTLTNLNELVLGFDGRYHATVPHDMLYGLIGLAQTEGYVMPDSLRPDYNKKFAVVCWQYAAAMIQATGDVRCIMRRSGGFQDGPSWVPDFTRPVSMNGATAMGMNRSTGATVSEDLSTLIIRGVSNGVVVQTYAPIARPAVGNVDIAQNLHLLDTFFKAAAKGWGVSSDSVVRRWMEDRRKPHTKVHKLSERERYYWAIIDGTDHGLSSVEVTRTKQWFSQLVNVPWLATSTGGLVQFCKADAKVVEGDVVVALQGLTCGLVLRPYRTRYKFVGDGLPRGHLPQGEEVVLKVV